MGLVPVPVSMGTADAQYVNVSGDTMTGALNLPGGSANVSGLTIGGDANLYRSAANVLKTDDHIVAGLTSQAVSYVQARSGHATDGIWLGLKDASTSAAGVLFGTAQDTNLYRAAANQLKTDDTLIALDGITTKIKAGIPADTDFATTPPDGTMAVDTTNSKLYVRIGGVWKATAALV